MGPGARRRGGGGAPLETRPLLEPEDEGREPFPEEEEPELEPERLVLEVREEEPEEPEGREEGREAGAEGFLTDKLRRFLVRAATEEETCCLINF